MAVAVSCTEISQQFGTQTVLDGVAWSLPPGAIAGLVGASGAGKTSLLRILAGLDACRSGTVKLAPAGSDARNSPARIGMVFQSLALWPHMTARRHVESVLSSGGARERRIRADAILDETLFPASARDRRPAELSGGEAQRLALARALANEPDLLLLDEPLAQLDMPLRAEMLSLIQNVARARGTTVIYVTHSWPEVLEICNYVAVLIGGRMAQAGSLDDIYHRPANPAVARLTGPVCEIPGECLDRGEVLVVSDKCLHRDQNFDGSCLVVRPHQVHLSAAAPPNCWRVASCRPSGAGWRLVLELENGRRQLRMEAPTFREPGESLSIHLALDHDSQKRTTISFLE